MEGYHQSVDNNTSYFKVAVTNVNDFNALLHRAKKEAKQLDDTITELENFYLKVEFSVNKDS
ncbi:hypothetical protein [Trichococcus flocculiformis]|uniref:hypothetical protein n=1 Tax=Trichococcus flocculiformis TaxID=82803 RepID=UPI003DA5DC84